MISKDLIKKITYVRKINFRDSIRQIPHGETVRIDRHDVGKMPETIRTTLHAVAHEFPKGEFTWESRDLGDTYIVTRR